jgi:hypothetical protein
LDRRGDLFETPQIRIFISQFIIYKMPLYHRHSIRLSGYDYSQAGEYFITICVQNREHLFGEIINDEMILNDAGKMIEKWYLELSNKFPDIATEVYCVMPNHFHAIIVNTGKNVGGFVGATLRGCPNNEPTLGEHTGSPLPENNMGKTDNENMNILDERVGATLCGCPNPLHRVI